MGFLKNLWQTLKNRIEKWLGRFRVPLRTVKVEELPDILDQKSIYVVGEGSYLWFVAMVCPCGCKAMLNMSLMPDDRPKWNIEEHNDGTITLQPSILRIKGCCSHFFLRKGKVEWCEPKHQSKG